MARGGARPGAGRPPKADEEELQLKLSKLDDDAFTALEAGVQEGNYKFVRLFFEYRFGKPKEKLDVTTNGESISAIKIVDVDGTGI